jgi:hypothetical protein
MCDDKKPKYEFVEKLSRRLDSAPNVKFPDLEIKEVSGANIG